MLDAALAHVKKVGTEQAYKDFTVDKNTLTKKDLYAFAMNLTGTMIAHGANEKMVGRDLINLKDSSGEAGWRLLMLSSAPESLVVPGKATSNQRVTVDPTCDEWTSFWSHRRRGNASGSFETSASKSASFKSLCPWTMPL